jgi:predicted O-methyltransferase YrrM
MTSREITPFLPLDNEQLPKPFVEKLQVGLFGAISWPWLLKSLYGGPKKGRAALLDRLGLPQDALPNLGSWKADVGFLTLISDHVLDLKPQSVMELGAGASSLIIARALQINGTGSLLSIDQHKEFSAATQEWLLEHGLSGEIRHAPLRPAPAGWPGVWYDHGPLPDSIDLLVIDGPPWTIHPYVRGSAETLFDRIALGGVILLDDAARPGERIVARRWRKRWPGFEFKLVHSGTKGTLMGKRLR